MWYRETGDRRMVGGGSGDGGEGGGGERARMMSPIIPVEHLSPVLRYTPDPSPPELSRVSREKVYENEHALSVAFHRRRRRRRQRRCRCLCRRRGQIARPPRIIRL